MTETTTPPDAEQVTEAALQPLPEMLPFTFIRDFMEALGLTEDDQVHKIEVSSLGIVVTCFFTMEGKRFAVPIGEDVEAPLMYTRVIGISPPEPEQVDNSDAQ